MNYKALDDDILCGEDGYWIYWPTGNRGAHTSGSLRLIAQILDELNVPVDKHYQEVTWSLSV